jgi:hypothetical protein
MVKAVNVIRPRTQRIDLPDRRIDWGGKFKSYDLGLRLAIIL